MFPVCDGLEKGDNYSIMRLNFYLLLIFIPAFLQAQPPQQKDFLKYQKSFKTVSDAFVNHEDSLKAQFEAKGLVWPAKYVYIRSFKYDSQLEVWVKDKKADPYKLFKTYKICALAGNLGPKRFEGDFQVPEGFYYFNEFKARSNYHLALGINYPNASDRVLSDSMRPGGDVYVHGSCVTVGCIPITDTPIEELYVLVANTRNSGQDYIPVHVFPLKFKKQKNKEMLEKFLIQRPDYQPMVNSLMSVYYYFEDKKQIPTILVNKSGEYFLAEDFKYVPKVVKKFEENHIKYKTHLPHMGWNNIQLIRQNKLLDDLQDEAKFYFLHSYYFECFQHDYVVATTQYGIDFSCTVNKNNIYGVQFHPEKSHQNGIQLLLNFANL